MIKVLSNEVYKLLVRKTVYIFIAILFVLSVFFVLVAWQSNSVLGNILNLSPTNAQSYPVDLLDNLASFILPMMVTILTAQMITGEYADGTLKLPLLRQVSRTKLFISKVISLAIVITIMMVCILIFGYFLGYLLLGWGQNYTIKSLTLSSGKALLFTLIFYAVNILLLISFSTIVSFFSIIIHGEGVIVGLSIGLLLLFSVVSLTFDNIGVYLPHSYVSIYTALDNAQSTKNAITAYSVSTAYGIFFFIIDLFVFKKQDILT